MMIQVQYEYESSQRTRRLRVPGTDKSTGQYCSTSMLIFLYIISVTFHDPDTDMDEITGELFSDDAAAVYDYDAFFRYQ